MRMRRAGSPPLRRHTPRPQPEERRLAIETEFITLGQLLKMTGIIGTGGEAKIYLAETVVQVNGEPEQRRGRKLRAGDVIVPPGEIPIRLIAAATDVTDEED
jgi:ribosome-associated protein